MWVPDLHRAILAGRIAETGLVAAGASVLAADPGSPASWVTGAGAFSAAGALIYIVRQMVDGRLVARNTAQVEADLAQLAKDALAREAAADKREGQLQALIAAAIAHQERPR